ncbi:MAG: transcription antitermination factor NusB [Candidatus Taylorbacteria bacterium RIFCSPLOWO2_12_FULL_43_20]|uniref:Transcription antitermination protein NusB n=1 Tax=Candidatus Taylorbacteria bacterium RIFCSPLOWO2_12_FULL_43_20 TaxID=1802332 RepID=A0A1G2P2I8_9BACT|nr:MAG: transcription antitermination factor NusB [Candidatus Taylorbacteria bacterium RIFCSPHIGHO2_02_FULL_43_55]OHA28312.1 MAG: transcription antitermination factor NusB [Candidatus Taylorbacteria bacterium RIFCSPHIGHO2_12_FULL_42_34]OHA30332.1 MAG: transcription antitermination factor NusB [Candidatus Taylorbacteria bacterium RIFCSPLOWO2_01_FULL_43_83]OHA37903.1 MAG: transcription antitermination factor NusB [Candidatus Taylorbacteria bacterium RIFCSPLOWO2_02_FULL_43_22b]OHA42555.1 MAG: tran
MANRHLLRSIAMQSLFEWDFASKKAGEIADIVRRNSKEFAPGVTDISFILSLTDNVIKKRSDLDQLIEKAAPEWPLDKISVVDRNVLRMGLYELLFSDREEVPAKVAINEAIELAKSFGGENSGKFVNGVLGSVYKELGEPGKDAVSKSKKHNPDIPYEEMPVQKLGGSVVYAKNKGEIYLALVHDIFGHWTLSKGKLETGEDVRQGTIRKIKEEIGLDVEIKDDLGKNEYVASDPELGKIRKEVHYFLAESPYVPIVLENSGGLNDAKWFKVSEIADLNFYNDILPIITEAINLLLRAHPRSNRQI